MALVPCFTDAARCAIGVDCPLSAVLREALDTFFAVLGRYTLADLATSRYGLAGLLGITTADVAAAQAV